MKKTVEEAPELTLLELQSIPRPMGRRMVMEGAMGRAMEGASW